MARIIYSLLAVIAMMVIFVNCQRQKGICHLDSCEGAPHTMCLYRSPKPAPQCGRYEVAGLNDKEIHEIVLTHNRLRAKVASGAEKRGPTGPQPAGKIGKLVWDKKLAFIAQRWANQCIFGHDKCRNTPLYPVGQNIGYVSWSDDYHGTYPEIIQNWYDEVIYFDRNRVSNFQKIDGPTVGHYTQLVWGATKKIGCGGIKYKDAEGYYTTHLVCNYGPAGNRIGDPVYQWR